MPQPNDRFLAPCRTCWDLRTLVWIKTCWNECASFSYICVEALILKYMDMAKNLQKACYKWMCACICVTTMSSYILIFEYVLWVFILKRAYYSLWKEPLRSYFLMCSYIVCNIVKWVNKYNLSITQPQILIISSYPNLRPYTFWFIPYIIFRG